METKSGEGEFPKSGRVCLVCKRQFAKYTCPKCNLAYCSLTCYKGHSETCSERFYKENVDELLKSKRVSAEDKKKMIQILQNQRNADEQDMDYEYILKSLEEVKLSEEEEEEVKRAALRGELSEYIELWDPWWTRSPLIEDNNSEEQTMPSILSSIPKLSSLTKATPAPSLKYDLLNLLYAYAFTNRFLNGELFEDVTEACNIILQLSPVLSSKANYSSFSTAIQESLQQSLKPNVFNSKAFSVAVLKDVADIVQCKKYVLCALSQMHDLFEACLKLHNKSKGKNALLAAQRKIYFFLAWTNEQSDALFESLRNAVLTEWNQQLEFLKTQPQQTPIIQTPIAQTPISATAQTPSSSTVQSPQTSSLDSSSHKPLIQEL